MSEHTPDTAATGRSHPLRRIAALLYDLVISVPIMMFIGALALIPNGGQAYAENWKSALSLTAALLGVLAYFMASWHWGGQTVGMKAWRIRVQDRRSQHSLSLRRCGIRLLVGCVLLASAGLLFLPAFFQRQRRSLADLASDSIIVHIPKGARATTEHSP